MATPTKTIRALQSLANVGASSSLISSVIDVSSYFAGTVGIWFGRRSATAFTTAPTFRVEFSFDDTADGRWQPYTSFQPVLGSSLTSISCSVAVSAGTNVISISSTTNLAVQDFIYLSDPTVANGEWARIKSIVAATSITLEENVVNTHTTLTIFRAAEAYFVDMDFISKKRVRSYSTIPPMPHRAA